MVVFDDDEEEGEETGNDDAEDDSAGEVDSEKDVENGGDVVLDCGVVEVVTVTAEE
ncbi:hypothetical protein GYMLUDRAFT_37959 [Collybiopsis luxurians FD-317 M1]|nr:hypothetical protein GYMLUDRAFT_37959 [Collybiopsis luxurians FD-317 M1]